MRVYLFGSSVNLPDQINIKSTIFLPGTKFFVNNFYATWDRAMILTLSCFSRQGGSTYILFTPKITILINWILTSGHPRSRSRIDLNRSCCIAFDASWREEHLDTYLMSPSHSNQKLCLKRNVYWPYDAIIWLGPDTSSATICKQNHAFPDRKNVANRMVYVIKEHSCTKFVVFLHVWFGVTKSMVSLDRFLLRGGYLTYTDVLHVFCEWNQ